MRVSNRELRSTQYRGPTVSGFLALASSFPIPWSGKTLIREFHKRILRHVYQPTQTTRSGIPDAMDVPGESVWLPNVRELLPGSFGLLQAQLLGMPSLVDQAPNSVDRGFWVGFRTFSGDPNCMSGSLPDQVRERVVKRYSTFLTLMHVANHDRR